MPRSICTGWTCVLKVVLPALWITTCLLATLVVAATGGRGAAEVAVAWVLGLAFFWWQYTCLKQVAADGGALYISNYGRPVRVPLTEIEKVSENRWIGGHPIWITFRRPTAFGRRIMFMPPLQSLSPSSHPIVKELRRAAGLQRLAA